MPKSPSREATFEAVTDYVCQRGGVRLLGQRRFVRRCCDWIQAAPSNWTPSESAIRSLIRDRAREECGSVFVAIVLPMILNLVASLIWEWIRRRDQESAHSWHLRLGDHAS